MGLWPFGRQNCVFGRDGVQYPGSASVGLVDGTGWLVCLCGLTDVSGSCNSGFLSADICFLGL